VTNELPRALLLDYSCLDNLKMQVLQNTYYRTCLNYAEIAAFVYETCKTPTLSTSKIHHVVKRAHQEGTAEKINAFRNLLKFPLVVPDLVHLLTAGGIWTMQCETAYAALVKCKVEHVCSYLFFFTTAHYLHNFQAIRYVVTACANQADSLNTIIGGRYQLYDVLPGGEPDITKDQYAKLLAIGDKHSMLRLPSPSSPKLFNAFDKSISTMNITVFGPLVCILII
jgi:hypothetical protein